MAIVAIAASSSGDNTVLAAVAGKKIVVEAYEVSASAAVNVKWKDGASTDKTGLLYLAAAGSSTDADATDVEHDEDELWTGTTNTALILNLSGAVAVGGWARYRLD